MRVDGVMWWRAVGMGDGGGRHARGIHLRKGAVVRDAKQLRFSSSRSVGLGLGAVSGGQGVRERRTRGGWDCRGNGVGPSGGHRARTGSCWTSGSAPDECTTISDNSYPLVDPRRFALAPAPS